MVHGAVVCSSYPRRRTRRIFRRDGQGHRRNEGRSAGECRWLAARKITAKEVQQAHSVGSRELWSIACVRTKKFCVFSSFGSSYRSAGSLGFSWFAPRYISPRECSFISRLIPSILWEQ